MNKSEDLTYIKELDGLRAVSVIAVVFYHCRFGLSGNDFWLAGGYLGVDVFFVLSGFLITRLLISEQLKSGNVVLLRFYFRRIKRLFPALLFMICAVSIAAFCFLVPTRLEEFANSSIATVIFVSNVFFYFTTTSYGAESSLLKPLLHTWSLSVEEQFYIIFPLLFIFLTRLRLNLNIVIIFVLLCSSLLFAEFLSNKFPAANFFLPFSRYWELLIGALLAFTFFKKEQRNGTFKDRKLASEILTIFSLIFLIVSFISFNGKTHHPGVLTLFPVMSVVALIWFAPISRFGQCVLGSLPLVWIGKLSYSIYLWHFPILALARIIDPDLSNLDKVNLVILSLVLAVFSYYAIEKPFRYESFSKKFVFAFLFTQIIAVLIFSSVVKSYGGFPSRIKNEGILVNYNFDNNQLLEQRKNTIQPITWAEDDRARILVVGNSHSLDTYNAFHFNEELFQGLQFRRYVSNTRNNGVQINCFDESNESNAPKAQSFYSSDLYQKADILVVSTRFVTGFCVSNLAAPKSKDGVGFDYLVARARKDAKAVIVFGPMPEFPNKDGITHLADSVVGLGTAVLGRTDLQSLKSSVNSVYYKNVLRINHHRKDIKQRALKQNVPYIDKYELICANEMCKGIDSGGFKIFADQSHLTVDGARFMGLQIARAGFRELALKLITNK